MKRIINLQVAILYSSSQNSLQFLTSATQVCPSGQSQSFIHQVRILSLAEKPSQAQDIASQSFIHQVRILSGWARAKVIGGEQHLSQSFIHQVRILSGGINIASLLTRDSRNPLFIKSEFSLVSVEQLLVVWNKGRNPLFIKSEFSQRQFCVFVKLYITVAILYSSSQNSLQPHQRGEYA